MDDKEVNRMIDEALDIPIPEGLAERLEAQIDELAAKEKKHNLRRIIYWAASTAAVILLCIGLFVNTNRPSDQMQTADTFTDPAEAALVAEQALAFISTQLNKGLDQVTDAGQEIDKVNKIVYKHLVKE